MDGDVSRDEGVLCLVPSWGGVSSAVGRVAMSTMPKPTWSDRAARLAAFDEFIEGEATRAAKKAHDLAIEAFVAIDKAALDLSIDGTSIDDLAGFPGLLEACEKLQAGLRERRAAVRSAATVLGRP